MCASCYNRWRYLNSTPAECVRCTENRLIFGKKMCKSCYQVMWKTGGTASRYGSDEHRQRISTGSIGKHKGESSGRWKGGRFIAPNGYVRILPPENYEGKRVHGGRYVHEHHLVAEQALNRLLGPGEIIHHRNRDRADNSLCNLVLLPSVSAHRRLHVAEFKLGYEVHPSLTGGILLGVLDGSIRDEELPLISYVPVKKPRRISNRMYASAWEAMMLIAENHQPAL